MKEDVLSILRHLDSGENSVVLEQAKKLGEYKNDIRECIDLMMLWFKDLLLVKATGDVNRVVYQEHYPTLRAQASVRGYHAIEEAVKAMEHAKAQLASNVNFDNVMELMLLQLRAH